MEELDKTPCRMRLEVFAFDSKGKEVREILLELEPGDGGGDESIGFRAASSNEDAFIRTIEYSVRRLIEAPGKMAPGSLAESLGEEMVVVRMPAGEGSIMLGTNYPTVSTWSCSMPKSKETNKGE